MKIFLMLNFLIISIFASEVSTKDDINELRKDIRESHRMILEVMNKRFEAVDKRFEAVDKRFEFMQNLMMGLLASIFGAIGYMFWDRQKSFKEAKEEYKKELNAQLIKKADKKTLEEVIVIIEELANKDDVVKDILARHHLRVVES